MMFVCPICKDIVERQLNNRELAGLAKSFYSVKAAYGRDRIEELRNR